MTRRFLLYSHDTYGLGHLRRNTTIATAIAAAASDTEVLLVSGSPRSASFPLPPRTDIVQLPSVTKTSQGAYEPRRLTGDLDSVVELRSAVIDATIRTYRPDVMVVDHAPGGMGGELLAVLERVSSDPLRPRLVLGLREIIDSPASVARQWGRGGVWNALSSYDDVLVYGDQRVLSTAAELELERRLGRPVIHVGYCAPTQVGSDLRTTEQPPLVVVTVGGGGDGHEICDRYLDYLDQVGSEATRSVIVTGPLMSRRRRAQLESRVSSLGRNVDLRTFEPEMRDLLNSAEAVVSMGGYNTIVELLAGGIPALVVPRTNPRQEQRLRAERLEQLSHLQPCPIDELSPERLDNFVTAAVGNARHPVTVDLGGAHRVAQLLTDAVREEPVSAHG